MNALPVGSGGELVCPTGIQVRNAGQKVGRRIGDKDDNSDKENVFWRQAYILRLSPRICSG